LNVAYLISVDGVDAELIVDNADGVNLNAAALALLEEVKEDFQAEEYRCAIYIASGGRLTLVGEEFLEG
jgi:soluble P-type ATPase